MSFKGKLAATGVVASVGLAGGYTYLERENEIPEFLLTAADTLPEELPAVKETLICAADTSPCTAANALGTLVNRKQVVVALADTSPHMQQAVVDVEDRRFWEHNGCDAKGIARAIHENSLRIAKNKLGISKEPIKLQGGSTIARQTASVIYPKATDEELISGQAVIQAAYSVSPEVAQQAYECTLAMKMNQQYSKEQILEKYLNSVYFGRGAIGIEAAAQAFFGINSKDLNVHQSIVLTATLNQPSRTDVDVTDDKDPAQAEKLSTEYDRLLERSHRIADTMVSIGHLGAEEAAAIKAAPIPLIPYDPGLNGNKSGNAQTLQAQHFLSLAKKDAAAKLGIPLDELSEGYRIYTTLSTANQAALRDAIKKERRIRAGGLAAAGISLSNDNAVTAMIGNTSGSQVNIAIGKAGGGGGRDGGSILKGFVWAKGYEAGMPTGADGTLPIGQSVVIPKGDGNKDWTIDSGNGCRVLGKSVPCAMTPEQALAASSNIATGLILNKVGGIRPIAERMVALGVDLEEPFYTSNVIGTGAVSPLGVATGYSNLVQRRGNAAPSYFISKITDESGKHVLYEHAKPQEKRVYADEVALQATRAMLEVYRQGTAKGTASPVMLERSSVAGKTGTGNNTSDLWAATIFGRKSDGGQTTVLWAGNPSAKTPIKNMTSTDMARIGANYAQDVTDPKDFSSLVD